MNFLTEHKIEQYAELTVKIAEVAVASEQAADSLKEVEKRLTDMWVQTIKACFSLVNRLANSTPSRLASSGVISPGQKDWRTW